MEHRRFTGTATLRRGLRMLLLAGLTVALTVAVVACGGEPTAGRTSAGAETKPLAGALPLAGEPVQLDPATFTTTIDNPYWPMAPGTTWTYSEMSSDGREQTVRVTVTDRTRVVMGIESRVVHDVVTQDGQLVEDTYDWYAQDATGTVWYLGEDTKEYEGGEVVSTEGSWEAGVDGALPGVIMPAAPQRGITYRQEYYAGQAEDAAMILSVGEWVEVPFGAFRDVVMTRDFTPLHPEILEYKFYAKGIGPVLVLGVSGGSGREELVSFERQ